MELIRIPQERVAVLIGTKGATKKQIERQAKIKLKVDSEGAVEIRGEPYAEFKARDIIQAIGRGFSPDDALPLLSDDAYLRIIDLKHLGTDRAITRIKARIIGEGGKARRMIEETSGVRLSLYGHTVSIIGLLDEVELASKAIEQLLEGKPHSAVYANLQKGRRKMKEERLMHMWQS